MFSVCSLASLCWLAASFYAGQSAPLHDINLCRDDYAGFKLVTLTANTSIYDLVTTTVSKFETEGKVRVLFTTGHKGFIFHRILLLAQDEHLGMFLKAIPVESILDFYVLPARDELHDYVKKRDVNDAYWLDGSRIQSEDPFSFTAYHTLESIYQHLEDIAELFPNVVEMFELDGVTHEGQKVKGVRITSDVKSRESQNKPLVFIEGGMHSREWIAPATVMYIFEALIGLQEEDFAEHTSSLIRDYQFELIPVANPDGYVWSRSDRLWRKTTQFSGCVGNLMDCSGECYLGECYGTDPNRNWDVEYGLMGSSTNPCDDSFRGSVPFDQNITVMLRDYLINRKDKLVLYVDYHSYSQLLVYPWGYTEKMTPDFEHHQKVGAAFVDAVAQRHGKHYKHHSISRIFIEDYPGSYEVSGTSIDWVYKNLGLVDTYGVELRDKGEKKFLLPAQEIIPCAEENFDGLLALMDNIKFVDGN